jgi:hypothetical protein
VTLDVGVVLDTGAFIALERRDRIMVELARRFVRSGTSLITSAGVVARVWRGGSGRQVPIAFLLRRTTVFDLTYPVARLIGRVLGARGRSDPIDGHVALLARERGWPILSSDPDDLRALDPSLHVERIG